jgi:hypothetical protein
MPTFQDLSEFGECLGDLALNDIDRSKLLECCPLK